MRFAKVYTFFLLSLMIVPFIGENSYYPVIPLSIIAYSVVSLTLPHQFFLTLFYDSVFHFPYRFSYTLALLLVLSLKNLFDVRLSVEGGLFYKTFFSAVFIIFYSFVAKGELGILKLITSLALSEILILEEVSHGMQHPEKP